MDVTENVLGPDVDIGHDFETFCAMEQFSPRIPNHTHAQSYLLAHTTSEGLVTKTKLN